MLPYIAYMDPMGHGISSLGDRGFVQHERWVLGGRFRYLVLLKGNLLRAS